MKPLPELATTLIKARELIAEEKSWCRGTYIRCDNGQERFCAMGALMRTTEAHPAYRNVPHYCEAEFLLCRAAFELYGRSHVIGVNDDCSHQAVLRCFDWAISAAIETP